MQKIARLYCLRYRPCRPIQRLLLPIILVALCNTATVYTKEKWVSIGPWGDEVRALAIHPSNPFIMYVGAYSGLFRSTNGGERWEVIGQEITDVTTLAIDPANPSIVYAGTGWVGMFRSGNGGDTWKQINRGITTSHVGVRALVIDPLKPSNVYIGTSPDPSAGTKWLGVLRSANHGDSWTTINNGLGNLFVRSMVIDPVNPSILYVGTGGGIFRTTNRGDTWAVTDPNTADLEVRVLAVDPLHPSTVYAGTQDGKGLFRTTDGGASWTAFNNGLTDLRIGALAVDSRSPSTIYAGTLEGGMFRSLDAGENWTSINTGLSDLTVLTLALVPSDASCLWAGTLQQGVFRSDDSGQTWTSSNTGLRASGAVTLTIDPEEPAILYGAFTGSGAFRSNDWGDSWTSINTGLESFRHVQRLVVDPTNPSTLYAAVEYGGGVARSQDRGETWTHIVQGMPAADRNAETIAIDPVTPSTIFAGTWRSVYKSTNSGDDWTNVLTGTSIHTRSICIDPTDTATVYVGTRGSGILRSTDGGNSWTSVTAELRNRNVYVLVMDPETPAILYAGTLAGGAYRTTNAGNSWVKINRGLEGDFPFVYAIAIDPQNPSALYLAADSGVYRSSNRGDTWTAVRTGLDSSRAVEVVIDPLDPSRVYAGTWSSGTYRLEWIAPSLCFAQFGEGAGQFFSQLTLFNLDDSSWAEVEILLRDDEGRPLASDFNDVVFDGQMTTTIPASGLRILRTDGDGPVTVGSVQTYSEQDLGGTILFSGSVGVAGVGSSEPLENGFLAPMETNSIEGVNTGVAMVNLGSRPMKVNLQLCNPDGEALATSEVSLPPEGHLARYVNEFTWDETVSFTDLLGLLKVDAPEPLAATVIQTWPGEFATMPVAARLNEEQTVESIQNETTEYPLYFAHFGEGNGQLFSQILLINRQEVSEARATVYLRDDEGQPLSVDLNGVRVQGETQLTIPAGGLRVLQTDGLGELSVGSASVTSDQPLAGVVLFGGSIGVAGVCSSEVLENGFTAPMETHSAERISTGVAIMNLEMEAVTLDLALYDAEGEVLARAEMGLPAHGHRARFLHEFGWNKSVDFSEFQGTLRANTNGNLAATVLQTRPGQLATMPVASR